ncbi:MAG: acetyl-CoA carboxylase biotin carboxylase subunit [Nitrososphaerales archaeon]
MPEFKRVLIANRGEIAVRIIRALDTLGIDSVAVYSDADSFAAHVSIADRAFNLPGVYPVDTYLNANKVIEIALKAECDAIHPGYGFLSESSEFSKLCEDNSIKFIGPSPHTLSISGNKLECKKLVESRGVPVIPYSREPLESWEGASKIASEIGYPVLLKSAFGGGGRGIKEAKSRSDLKESFESSQREAVSAFGRFAVFLEKKLVKPRHVEVQILASDDSSDIIHLGERECSIQRRYQKLIEMSPSPIIDDESRKKISDYALRAASAVNYANAGTVEFLRDSASGEFYFIEINSRLQVEHPVTESVTGLDLVALQIGIASRKKLPLRQREVQFRGCAIECRINAEDPLRDFIPVSGRVDYLQMPSGVGIRVDTALALGSEISPYYDSLVAKLVSWADDFETARMRSLTALRELSIVGLETTIPFCALVLADPSFISGDISTGFIEDREIIQRLRSEREALLPEDLAIAAIVLSRNRSFESKSNETRRRARSHMPYSGERFADAI